MLSGRPGGFALKCPEIDCNRLRAFYYLDGQVTSELRGREIPFYPKFKLQLGHLETTADLIRDAVDLHLIGRMNPGVEAKDAAYRGAAIHLRVAAQFLAGYVMKLDQSKLREFGLGPLIGKIGKGCGWPRVKKGHRSTILGSLDYLRNLGDTAAHQLLREPAREVPPTRGNVERGFAEFDKIVDAVKVP